MNSKRALEIELELYEECQAYIVHGTEPRDETMEACFRAFEAVQDYRKVLKKEEARRAATQADN